MSSHAGPLYDLIESWKETYESVKDDSSWPASSAATLWHCIEELEEVVQKIQEDALNERSTVIRDLPDLPDDLDTLQVGIPSNEMDPYNTSADRPKS